MPASRQSLAARKLQRLRRSRNADDESQIESTARILSQQSLNSIEKFTQQKLDFVENISDNFENFESNLIFSNLNTSFVLQEVNDFLKR